MQFAFDGDDQESAWLRFMREGLQRVMTLHGHAYGKDPQEAELVFHVVQQGRPRPFRRQSKAVFVVGVVEGSRVGENPVRQIYPLLLRSLSNLLIYGGDANKPWAYLVTPELGCYPAPDAERDALWFEELYSRIAPLANSRLVIDNQMDQDLPQNLALGTQVTRQMKEASRVLALWNLFPTPYPLTDMLSPEDYRHLRLVFGVGGISYGNLSARHDDQTFWMSASGVNKGKIGMVSRDILMVKGYDPGLNAMRLSVSPDSDPLRVSVDAVEHWGVYRTHPEIGAMIHIHAWVEGIPSTEVNYPCGTVEMGQAMSHLLDQDPHPERTIIGLRNHGITATGPDFPDILNRLEGRVQTQVPMS